jgi:hypothetical protein
MAVDAKEWKKLLDQWVEEQVIDRAVKVQKTILLDALGKVVEKTPVGNRRLWKRNIERAERGLTKLLPKGYVGGHARRNWQLKKDRRPTKTLKGTRNDAQQRGERAIARIDEPCIAYLSNLLPYMNRLENGWSTQAKDGIVGPTVRELLQKYRRIR